MYLDQLAYFIEVINCGSISQAAKNLYISQPALSQSIANLENELGTKLIKRSYSGIRPTMFGEQVYSQASEFLSRLDGALTSWKEQAAKSMELSGTALVLCTPDTNDFLSTVVMEEMQNSYPNVVLSLSPCVSMYFSFDVLDENNASICIGSSLSGLLSGIEKEAESRGLCYECFSTEYPSLLLNRRNTLASQEYLSADDLKSLKIAIFPSLSPPPFASFFSGISCQLSTEEALAAFVAGNINSAALLIPSDTKRKIASKRRSLTIVPIKPTADAPELQPVSHFLIYKKPELLNPAEQSVLKVIKHRLSEY